MKVYIRASLWNKLWFITNNFKTEVGGYLTGKIINGEVYLQDVIIPRQNVTGVSVDISPEAQLEMRREYKDKCFDIIFHWHSHAAMGAFWSGTDEENMRNIMFRKKVFGFLVTSSTEPKYKCRVSIREPISHDFEDCSLELSDLTFKFLKNRVDNMVNNDNRNRDSELAEVEREANEQGDEEYGE